MGKYLLVGAGLISVMLLVVMISLLLIKVGWYLFMVPVFNLPDLTWGQALGLSLLASCFKSSSLKNSNSK